MQLAIANYANYNARYIEALYDVLMYNDYIYYNLYLIVIET